MLGLPTSTAVWGRVLEGGTGRRRLGVAHGVSCCPQTIGAISWISGRVCARTRRRRGRRRQFLTSRRIAKANACWRSDAMHHRVMLHNNPLPCIHLQHRRQVALDGKTLQTELAVTNTGKEAFDFQAALHSYFRCSDINKVGRAGRGREGGCWTLAVMGMYVFVCQPSKCYCSLSRPEIADISVAGTD